MPGLARPIESELYDPGSNSFRRAAKALVPRLYHSVALLLPDARVITAGSNPNRRDDELRLEVPREPGILPPGWYMLFLTDNDGVPSHAHWVRVTA